MDEYQHLAEKTLLRALELEKPVVYAHFLLGQIYGIWTQYESAILQYQKPLLLYMSLMVLCFIMINGGNIQTRQLGLTARND